MELTNPEESEFVSATVANQSYRVLRSNLYDEAKKSTRPTESDNPTYERTLEIEVTLPAGNKSLRVNWIDTPGEIWRQHWQKDNPKQWLSFLKIVRDSDGIILIVSPYRDMLKPGTDGTRFVTKQQWCRRFERWVRFFQQDCPRARHILLCLNMADLIDGIELESESSDLAYDLYRPKMNWQERHEHVLDRYFWPVQTQIEEINRNTSAF